MGIHYDYKSKRGERAMLKEAKRKARLAQRRAKRIMSGESLQSDSEVKTHDIKKKIEMGKDIFDRGINYKRVEIDSSFPKYIVDNKEKFKKWIIWYSEYPQAKSKL